MTQRPDMFPLPDLPNTPLVPPLYQYIPAFVTRQMHARIEDYMRMFQQRHAAAVNRGASQAIIERNTFPHKYSKIQRNCSEGDDNTEKCTICLSEFELNEDVRFVNFN